MIVDLPTRDSEKDPLSIFPASFSISVVEAVSSSRPFLNITLFNIYCSSKDVESSPSVPSTFSATGFEGMTLCRISSKTNSEKLRSRSRSRGVCSHCKDVRNAYLAAGSQGSIYSLIVDLAPRDDECIRYSERVLLGEDWIPSPTAVGERF